jgi:glycosyltransferase involved in cell wall biosynthesis
VSGPPSLRVAVVIPRYHPIFGGAENQCRVLNRALQADGRATPVFVLTKRLAPEMTPRDAVDGVPVFRLGNPGTSRWNEYAFYLRAAVRLVRERASYDVIHCHATALMGAAATIAGMVGRHPVVLKLSSNGEFATGYAAPAAEGEAPRRDRSLAGRLRRPFTALSARSAHIVALNREGFDELRLGRVRHAHLINNAVDTSAFRPPTAAERREARAALGIADDMRVVLFTGRFVAGKGIDTIQDALRLVRGRVGAGRLRMLLVGSAELQGAAVQPVDLDPEGDAHAPTLRVYPPTLDVQRYLWAADAFSYPSRREGMPNAVLEALAAGLPCILSDIRPHAELAERFPGRCTIFPVGDAAALADALLAVGSPGAPPRAEGPVAAEFTPGAVAARYVALYSSVVRGARVTDAHPAPST